jgi:hypothetical protein
MLYSEYSYYKLTCNQVTAHLICKRSVFTAFFVKITVYFIFSSSVSLWLSLFLILLSWLFHLLVSYLISANCFTMVTNKNHGNVIIVMSMSSFLAGCYPNHKLSKNVRIILQGHHVTLKLGSNKQCKNLKKIL